VISLRTADPTDKFEVIGRAAVRARIRQSARRADRIRTVTIPSSCGWPACTPKADGYFTQCRFPLVGSGVLAPPKHAPTQRLHGAGYGLWIRSVSVYGAPEGQLRVMTARSIRTFQCTNAPTGTVAPGFPPFQGGTEDCKPRQGYADPVTPILPLSPRHSTTEFRSSKAIKLRHTGPELSAVRHADTHPLRRY